MTEFQLSKPLSDSEDLKKDIIRRVWRRSKHEIELQEYAPYLDYYERTCHALYLGSRPEVKSMVDDHHEHLLLIFDTLWTLKSRGEILRPALRQLLDQDDSSYFRNKDDKKMNASIDVALRLWLTMNIKDDGQSHLSGASPWNDETYLSKFVSTRFPSPDPDSGRKKVLLGQDLVAVDLVRLSHVRRISWTRNLEEHLLFDKDNRNLKVYSYLLINTLHHQLRCEANILPDDLIKETLHTFNLLFPSWEGPRIDTFLQHAGQGHLTQTINEPTHLYLADYSYWYDRLADLHSVTESPPASWKQIWAERRNSLQWFTFLFATAAVILTLIFGITSSVTACMQTYYAYQSLQLARAAAVCTPPFCRHETDGAVQSSSQHALWLQQ